MRMGWSAAALPPLSDAPQARSARRQSGGRAAALHFVLLFFSVSAFASAITGRVISGGVPAAGVTVSVTSKVLQGERTTITTSTGRYWLTGLQPGRYDVTFSHPKLQTLTRRVLIELSRVARADATLEPSDDEETITSTAIPISVTETTAATSHYSDETFDRLPIRRDPISTLFISPGPPGGFGGFVNDAPSFGSNMFGRESLEQVTLVRAALPADIDTTAPPVYFARTRSGGEDVSFSLRDTISNSQWVSHEFPGFDRYDQGLENLVEATAGGRIVPEKLWFFTGAWHGSELFLGDRNGVEAKLTWQAAAQHNLAAFFTQAEVDDDFETDATIASVRYTGAAGPRLTNEVVLSRSSSGVAPDDVPDTPFRFRYDSLFAKTSYVAGSHVLSAGGRAIDTDFDDERSFFVNDRWSVRRLTINAGARHEFDRFSPRVAAAFDVRGNGRQAITASASDYVDPNGVTRELSLGFATAIGPAGSLRIDGLRRDYGPASRNGAQADFRYTMFDRFHTGGSYTWTERRDPRFFGTEAKHVAQAWAGVDVPVGDHEFGVTAMQHFRSRLDESLDAHYATDLALRYSLPVSRLRLTVAADVTNVFDTGDTFILGRTFRGWVRLRH